MSEQVLQAVLTVVFGALAGGLTNTVAVWMLFHPYEPPRLFGRRLTLFQGAIPKNKARLAKTIGRTVGQRLLTTEDLAHQLSAPGMREAFDHAVQHFVTAALDTKRGPLRDVIPAGIVPELEHLLEQIADGIADRTEAFVRTPEFRDAVERFLVRTRDQFADRPVGEMLTSARHAMRLCWKACYTPF